MIGTARSHAAVTIVNALPTGVGCALGIGLAVEARVTLRPSAPAAEPRHRYSRGAGTPVVREALRLALDAFGDDRPQSAAVELRSEIPPARGLKSSSAVATAVVRATARAFGVEPDLVDVARIAAGAGRTAGVSATGALDDALAGLASGFWVADCRGGRVLRHAAADAGWKIALYVPRTKHAPSPTWAASFELRKIEGAAAVDQALAGNWWTAMRQNTELVEETMQYDYSGLRASLREHGALASGVSGMGPTLAAVVDPSHAPQVLECLPVSGGTRQLVSVLAPTRGSTGGSP